MSQAPLTLPAWLPPSLREDPKKTMVLAVLLAVLLVFIGKWLIGGPSHASASPIAKPAAFPVTGIVSKAPPQPARFDGTVRAWAKRPVTEMPRNLFLIRSELFPRATSESVETAQVKPTFWDAVEKSQAQQADESKQRLILVQNLQREVAKLELQSTMMGPTCEAIISGTTIRKGSMVASDGGMSFRVIKIEATDVVVEREGVQLRLTMSR